MKRSLSQAGFTLIEMIVSLALFSIVVTISVGALLVLISSNQQLQKEQSVMTNLSFALDSMTREIRTGTRYYCDARPTLGANHAGKKSMFRDSSNSANPTDLDDEFGTTTAQDCASGNNAGHRYQGVMFVEGGESITGTGGRILYYYDDESGKIWRRVGGEAAQSIVSSGIFITDAEFFVTGTTPLEDGPTNLDQAAVTIFLEARDKEDATGRTYKVQTTVTQRTLDI